jgi:phage baseplate assembly protein W
MATYIGFSTQEVNQRRSLTQYGQDGVGTITQQPKIGKKFRLVDDQLVLRDFINAFNIKQGDKVGQPDYGTTIWDYVFDPNVAEITGSIEEEVRRIASQDSRIVLNEVTAYTWDNGILIEIQINFQPFNNLFDFGLYLDRESGIARAVMETSQ